MGFIKRLLSIFSSGNGDSQKADALSSPEKGVVRNFNHSRGFGFIHSKAFDRKIFLHISDMEKRVKVGQKVTFKVEQTEKGLRARNVAPLAKQGSNH